jgi:hypothetical protein
MVVGNCGLLACRRKKALGVVKAFEGFWLVFGGFSCVAFERIFKVVTVEEEHEEQNKL